jgi:hypothetical protein
MRNRPKFWLAALPVMVVVAAAVAAGLVAGPAEARKDGTSHPPSPRHER